MNNVIFKDMPIDIKAVCAEDADGFQTIVINSRLSRAQNMKSYLHEMTHLNDFIDAVDVNALESLRHEPRRS